MTKGNTFLEIIFVEPRTDRHVGKIIGIGYKDFES